MLILVCAGVDAYSTVTPRQTVEVSERADAVDAESATPTTFVDRSQIEHAPGADRTNSMAMITNFVPARVPGA
jgi:hypothetical protein